MRWLACVALAAAAAAVVGCGSDFQVPPLPDAHFNLDLAVSFDGKQPDLTCFNTACGGCSSWAKWDGTPVAAGDPCLVSGMWQCTGTELTCSSTACLSCPSPVTGTVCGADGHSIIELVIASGACTAYDFGSAISTCNRKPGDQCQQHCTNAGGRYDCAAHCLSDDGGGTGFGYSASETCVTLSL
jgi:hypothetical protein